MNAAIQKTPQINNKKIQCKNSTHQQNSTKLEKLPQKHPKKNAEKAAKKRLVNTHEREESTKVSGKTKLFNTVTHKAFQ
jgi:hypothetical protein